MVGSDCSQIDEVHCSVRLPRWIRFGRHRNVCSMFAKMSRDDFERTDISEGERRDNAFDCQREGIDDEMLPGAKFGAFRIKPR